MSPWDLRTRDELVGEVQIKLDSTFAECYLNEAETARVIDISFMEVGQPRELSPRQVARHAAAYLAASVNGRSQSSCARLSEQLRVVRDRHSLARRKYFYAFIDEIDFQLRQQLQVEPSPFGPAARFQHDPAASVCSPKPSFLSRLAAFLGLPLGAADREYRSLSTRDLELIWESVVEDVEAATVATDESLWHLLHDRFLQGLSATLTSRPTHRRVPDGLQLLRDRLLFFGFWTGTPPPPDVEALPLFTRHRARHPKSVGGDSEPFLRFRGRGDPQIWVLFALAEGPL